jgi:hypothetical protein
MIKLGAQVNPAVFNLFADAVCTPFAFLNFPLVYGLPQAGIMSWQVSL